MILKTHFFDQYNSITRKLRICKNSITTITKTVDNKNNLLLLYIDLLYRNKFIKTRKSCYTVILGCNLLIYSKLQRFATCYTGVILVLYCYTGII